MPIQLGSLTVYATEELARLLGVNDRTIQDYLRDGKLKGRKIGKRWHVSDDNLREFFNEGETGDTASDESD